MKELRAHLERLRKKERRKHHILTHKIHKKYNISKKTLFYVKEYGPHTNVSGTIIKESVKILLFASIISSFGGLALEHIKLVFISIIPLLILLPALNDMIGDYGSIVSSRFSAMLHEGKIKKRWWKNKEVNELFVQVFIISISTAIISSAVALIVSIWSNYEVNIKIASKILFITIFDVGIIVSILFAISIFAGLHFYKKKEDPNNFLIPIVTSVADFGNMIILAGLVLLFF